jgi:tetratricopeptide (TPR) repeat protein
VKSGAGHVALCVVIVGCLSLCAPILLAQDNKTVLGPSNVPLQDGANALKTGHGAEGVRLTLLGLKQARGSRERETAKSNLCAGYALLEQYELALEYCNEVLQENDKFWRGYSNRALIFVKLHRFDEAQQDLLKGEAISPNAHTLKAVRKMYRDAVNPVSPTIVIDDRRAPTDE